MAVQADHAVALRHHHVQVVADEQHAEAEVASERVEQRQRLVGEARPKDPAQGQPK